jgi:DNA adenine methylase
MTKPLVKWVGGKRRLIDELYQRFPKQYNKYHEPFFGGGALFFDLQPDTATINDTNTRLINLYRQVRDNPNKLIDRLKEFDNPKSDPDPDLRFDQTNRKGREIKNYYYQQRELFNNRPYDDTFDRLEEAALLMYLNWTCYNGLYRENLDGGFNSPIGSYENPQWIYPDRIHQGSELLQQVQIYNSDWSYVIDEAESGDLVYFDPPYAPMSRTENFTDYSADGFDAEDQKQLLHAAVTLSDNGVNVVLSNSGVMYDMYDDAGFTVGIEGETRMINTDSSKRGEVDEIIATNTDTLAQSQLRHF